MPCWEAVSLNAELAYCSTETMPARAVEVVQPQSVLDCYVPAVKLEINEQPQVALSPWRAIGTPSSVIDESPSRITLGLTSGCFGQDTSSPLRATKRPS